jgi:hypothetical protein
MAALLLCGCKVDSFEVGKIYQPRDVVMVAERPLHLKFALTHYGKRREGSHHIEVGGKWAGEPISFVIEWGPEHVEWRKGDVFGEAWYKLMAATMRVPRPNGYSKPVVRLGAEVPRELELRLPAMTLRVDTKEGWLEWVETNETLRGAILPAFFQ